MKIVFLSDICKVIAGQSPPSSTYNEQGKGLPFFQGKADFGYLYPKTRVWCSEPKKVAEIGDILLSVRAPVGPTNICNKRACIGRGLSAIRAGEKIDSKYLLYFLRSHELKLANQGKGSTFSAITQDEINKIKVPLPPIEDQKRIVEILNQADVLRQKRKEAIGLLDEYLKSFFLETFGDPIKNPKGWQKQKLGEMIDFMTSGSRGWAKYYSTTGDIFLRIQNVGKDCLLIDDLCFVNSPETAESRRTKVCPGDVLLSITADLGRTAVIPEGFPDAYINQHLAILRLKNGFIPEYVSAFLSSESGKTQIEQLNKGGTKAGLNFNDIKSISVLIPDIKFQKEYRTQRNLVLNLKKKMLSQSEELENQFQALMQKAFNGTI